MTMIRKWSKPKSFSGGGTPQPLDGHVDPISKCTILDADVRLMLIVVLQTVNPVKKNTHCVCAYLSDGSEPGAGAEPEEWNESGSSTETEIHGTELFWLDYQEDSGSITSFLVHKVNAHLFDWCFWLFWSVLLCLGLNSIMFFLFLKEDKPEKVVERVAEKNILDSAMRAALEARIRKEMDKRRDKRWVIFISNRRLSWHRGHEEEQYLICSSVILQSISAVDSVGGIMTTLGSCTVTGSRDYMTHCQSCLLLSKEKKQQLWYTVWLRVNCQVHVCHITFTFSCYLIPWFITLETLQVNRTWKMNSKVQKGEGTLWQRALLTFLLCWKCPVFLMFTKI